MESLAQLLSPGFFTGIAFAALLLCAGLAIGLWLGRQGELRRREVAASQQALQMVAGLAQWTERFAGDVGQYRELIDLFGRRLHELEERPDPPAAHSLLGRVAEANDQLQRRIENAEQALRKQADDITSYMTEARTDALTGLPNRRSFDDEFQRRIAQWRRQGTPFSLLLLDIDRFKQLNDTKGHPAGDAVLSEVGRLLRETIEPGEFAARYGGEEFVLLLPHDQQSALAAVCRRVRQAINQCSIPFEREQLRVTVSSGVAVAEEGELGPHLVKRADEALYAAKRHGRDCGYWHDGENCLLLDCMPSPAEHPPMPASLAREATASAEFRELCTDLRRKLNEISVPGSSLGPH